MNKLNIAYWVLNGLFAAFMVFSSIGGITLNEQAVAYLHDHMGYPIYFIRIISWAKVAGAVAILLPIPARAKEWAYFGFFIDLVVAVLSFMALGDPASQWWMMFLFIGVLIAAYLLHHKRLHTTR